MVGVSGGLRMTVLGCCCCRRDGVGDCGPGSGVMELSGESIVCRVRVLQINTGKQLDICEVKEGGYADRERSQPVSLGTTLEERRRRRQHNETVVVDAVMLLFS